MSVLFGLYTVGSSKSYGEKKKMSESFLSLTASLASVFGIFRFIWALPLDCNFSYKQVYGVMIVIQIVVAFGMNIFIKGHDFMFLICVGLS